ncbi:MAG: zinc ribbon domain-containing protein [Clostridiales bacterium]|nr:zinc ribbon domain-containing protein [Clostridiales bacterium]
MANFCTKCGKPLNDNAQFCRYCGNKRSVTAQTQEPKTKFCVFCGGKIGINAQFCSHCGKTLPKASGHYENTQTEKQQPTLNNFAQQQATAQQKQSISQQPQVKQQSAENSMPATQHTVADTSEQSFFAPASAGEVMLGRLNIFKQLSPGALIISRFKEFPKRFVQFFKEPRKLIPVIIMGVMWLVTYFLRAFGNNSLPTRLLSFISFSGKPSVNPTLLLGSMLGKGIFAGAVVSLISMLIPKKSSGSAGNNNANAQNIPPANHKRSFANVLKACFGVNIDSVWGYLLGIGTAFVFFLFISGGGGIEAMLGGVSAAFITCRATMNNGFIKQLISSVSNKLGKGDAQKEKTGTNAFCGIMRGMAVGFSASALLCAIPFSTRILAGLGVFLLLGGGVMLTLQLTGVINSGKKEAGTV